MYPSILIALLLTIFWLPLHAQIAQVEVQIDSISKADSLTPRVDQGHPEFPGGTTKLVQYIKDNLRYPKTARAAGLTGRVLVEFLITTRGLIKKVRVLNEISPQLDAEAIRLVESMPTWSPKKVNGQAVACSYVLPINFTLE